MRDKIVVFAPHPDDETLGCGGTIAKKSEEGHEISVVFLTDGRNCLKELGVLKPSPLELKEIRKREAKRAAEILGVPSENLIFLDIEDGMLRDNKRTAQEKITEVLTTFPKSVYLPQEREFHVDHRVTNHLVRTAIRKINFLPFEHQYIIAWRYPLNLLSRVRPEHIQDIIMSRILRQNIIHEDISNFLCKKSAALKEYQSQLMVLSREQKRPALKRCFLKGFLKRSETFFVK